MKLPINYKLQHYEDKIKISGLKYLQNKINENNVSEEEINLTQYIKKKKKM